ncbi:MAG TPA: AAA family ATPase [Kofleriaceae bacterium]|jgi:SpoVK/Ycf46/Vps4 family AAA+-type ATPase
MQYVTDLARAYLSRFLAAQAERKWKGGGGFGPSTEEIAAVLRTPEASSPAVSEVLAAENARLAALDAALRKELESEPRRTPLTRLAGTFGLSPLDVTIVALLLAPEIDHELERAYSYAVDDFTRKRPDGAFLARLISPQDRDKADAILVRLDEDAPLRRHRIVVASGGPDVPHSMKSLRIADRIVAFMRGHDTVDELVRGYVSVLTREPNLDDIVLAPELIQQVERAFASSFGQPRVLLSGPEGVGRALLVEALFARQGRPVVRVSLRDILNANDGRMFERVATALREVALRDGVAFLDGGPDLGPDAPRELVAALTILTRGLDVPVVFTLASPVGWLSDSQPSLVEIAIPAPSFAQRQALWRKALPGDVIDAEALDIIASRYAFTAGMIARSANRALQRARLRDPNHPTLTIDDVSDSARLAFTNKLEGLAQRIPTGFTWADLVLPHETMEGVKEVVRFGRQRAFLLEEWGFAKKLPYGSGVSAILAGPPGTGKTMVAQLIARELGYDLYRIDLSQVVNKYIGETEKNLGRIFDLAENSHAVLFFDEADSLFAKRTEVRSSNDRYANLEVNYLLQRMETFDGTTLLATNLEQGIDDAFKRRVRFTVQFELPDAPERAELWKSMFPPQVPLDEKIRWDQLGARYEMSGGYIKKAAVRAALRAAEQRRPVAFGDLVEAADHEYREMGRII